MAGFKRLVQKVMKKARRKVGQKITKRYYNKSNKSINVGQIASDVMRIKKLVNVEKKRITLAYSNAVGQFANLLNSFNILDITPVPVENVAYNGRTGASIKCVSYHMDVQYIHQGSTTQPCKGVMYVVLNKGAPLATVSDLQTFYSNMFVPNPFITGYGGTVGATGIIEYNSSFNPDYYGRFKIIQSKRFYVPADSISGQPMYKTVKIGKKWQHHIRYNKDSNTVVNGQLLLITLVDSGNAGGVSSSLTGVPTTGSSTAITQNINLVHYYVDN